ncbi:thioredoxin-dependent thiol peroxidase [Parvibaculum sedimenti]|uniref:thioredoxin-dependent thiol peroxidase n=1 Tax=Parvibaculum sedimenti TaxID=2608632 RepID=UPI001FE793A9|nr:thioredoxin-dependent thiol peroxidase [Parvibaculum sedimenti]
MKKAGPTAKPAAKAPAAKPKAAPKAKAATASTLPAVGRKAPAFSLPADDGSTISLSSLAGKKIVLYFYPKDDTPGCTVEAIAFSAQKAAFEAANAVVLGVSKDSVKAHCKFRDKHNLTVRLLSDETGEMLEAYGVWVEKSQYGRTYMGIARTTYLIDEKGVIAKIWPKVKVDGHADDVLAAVKSL